MHGAQNTEVEDRCVGEKGCGKQDNGRDSEDDIEGDIEEGTFKDIG